MKGIIDRFEGDRVLLELKDGIVSFDRELFPENAKEGDIVEYVDNRFVIRVEETLEREKYINQLFKSLVEKDK
ncbi:DUF3006 family protein [Keratinibaculum paraultunense]|uniref:DUF3006 family protein n=1 Tax=Keratinibaculum paraultunense TaxID=1278232 RepID=A0A4R3KW70_9FIRM|nr:DUF3006 domain-containing protein [Keratinibaculum paraultunense]QQY78772.1 DUF3006 domain-containing protein [Keratinibaculum paraultunense]TCS89543.1 DUF3006 family protein [Keratinibaculum paraultunense]